jgi:hypothetical protein
MKLHTILLCISLGLASVACGNTETKPQSVAIQPSPPVNSNRECTQIGSACPNAPDVPVASQSEIKSVEVWTPGNVAQNSDIIFNAYLTNNTELMGNVNISRNENFYVNFEGASFSCLKGKQLLKIGTSKGEVQSFQCPMGTDKGSITVYYTLNPRK